MPTKHDHHGHGHGHGHGHAVSPESDRRHLLGALDLIVLLRESGRVLLQAAPGHLDPDEIGSLLARQPAVVEVHDLHVWAVTSGYPTLSAHVLVEPGSDCQRVRVSLAELLKERFDIDHTTLQVDHGGQETDPAHAVPRQHCPDPHGPRHRSGRS